jgi:Cu-processing system ATP-binding protein
MATPILRTNCVSKQFDSLQALNEVSIELKPGERVALLGHNGAGKTTLFRIVLGFLSANSGNVEIMGHLPGSKAARRAISYLPESIAFPKMLTGREIISYYAKLKKASFSDVNGSLEKVDLVEAANRPCGTYSKGMRQRLGLAQALIGDPKLLLLDEPTSGLDPISRQRFYQIISDVSVKGTAVLLSSHGLSELEAKTDRVAILRKGALVANGSLSQLQAAANLPIRIRISSKPDMIENVYEQFGGRRINGSSVEFSCSQSSKMKNLAEISSLGDAINDVEIFTPTLDEIYRHFSASEQSEDM